MQKFTVGLGLLALFVLGACGGGGAAAVPPAPEPVAIAAPAGLALVPSGTSATLSWEPVTDALGYRVVLAAAPGIPQEGPTGMPEARDITAPMDADSITFTDLTPGTRYYAAVVTNGAEGDSALSAEVTALLAPARPTGIVLSAADGCLTLSWPATLGADRYDVFLATAAEIASANWSGLPAAKGLPGVGSPLTIDGLENGTTYYVVVRATNSSGVSPDSETVSGGPTARGTFLPRDPAGVGLRPIEMASGDLDGDGALDFVVCDEREGTVSFLRTTTLGTVELVSTIWVEDPLDPDEASDPSELGEPLGRHPIALADYDGDGILDLALGLRPGEGVRVFVGDGAFGFSEVDTIAAGSDVSALASADMDGNGVADLLLVDADAATVGVWLGDGQGAFSLAGEQDVGGGPSAVVCGDVNDDGQMDLIVTNTDADSVSVFLGDGTGDLGSGSAVGTQKAPQGAALGDMDGDGRLDLLVTASGDAAVQCFLGQGDGSFSLTSAPAVQSDPRHLAVADFNADGILDLVVSNHGASSISVFRGVGDGSFTLLQTLTFPDELPGRIEVGDFDGDGLLDLAMASRWSGALTIFAGSK